MKTTCQVTHATPADQPSSVHEMADRLFPAYTVDEGKVHLAGCLLQDRLFVRLDFMHGDDEVQVFIDEQGNEVDASLIEALGMGEVERLAKPPAPYKPQVERATARATQLIQSRFSGNMAPELTGTTAIWCKFAEGKLRFDVGEASADLPFADWARTLQPPPFVCQQTSASSFHLAATDDGRIVPADQIECCAETGQRVVASDLAACAATGRHVLPELLATCPVSGQRVIEAELVCCEACRQSVAPSVIARGQCSACRSLKSVRKADPRMARLLDEHPPLDRWRNWRMAETASVYILEAAGWVKQLLLVVDKESLELLHLATGSRLSGRWTPVAANQYDFVLRE